MKESKLDVKLREAITEGSVPKAKFLLMAGANPNLTLHGEAALIRLTKASYPFKECIKLFIDIGADVNATSVHTNKTALMLSAIYPSYPDIMEWLLKAGADPTLKDNKGHDVVHFISLHNTDKQQKLMLSLLKQYGGAG